MVDWTPVGATTSGWGIDIAVLEEQKCEYCNNRAYALMGHGYEINDLEAVCETCLARRVAELSDKRV